MACIVHGVSPCRVVRAYFLSVVVYSRVVIDNYNKYMLVIKKEVKTYPNGVTRCSRANFPSSGGCRVCIVKWWSW